MTKTNADKPASLTSENKSDSYRLPGFFCSPVALIRVSSVLVVLETVGHITGYPWTSSHVLQETQLVRSMKSVDFLFFGERSSYWNLYSGWGLFIAVLLLTLAIILWLLSNLRNSTGGDSRVDETGCTTIAHLVYCLRTHQPAE